jgi:hypothetical protein
MDVAVNQAIWHAQPFRAKACLFKHLLYVPKPPAVDSGDTIELLL